MPEPMPAEAAELLTAYVPADVHARLTYWQYEPEQGGQYGWQHSADGLGGVLWLQRTHDGRLRTYDEVTMEFHVGEAALAYVEYVAQTLRKLG